eukprot:5120882-Pyramimonas_sp.AAC.1
MSPRDQNKLSGFWAGNPTKLIEPQCRPLAFARYGQFHSARRPQASTQPGTQKACLLVGGAPRRSCIELIVVSFIMCNARGHVVILTCVSRIRHRHSRKESSDGLHPVSNTFTTYGGSPGSGGRRCHRSQSRLTPASRASYLIVAGDNPEICPPGGAASSGPLEVLEGKKGGSSKASNVSPGGLRVVHLQDLPDPSSLQGTLWDHRAPRQKGPLK